MTVNVVGAPTFAYGNAYWTKTYSDESKVDIDFGITHNTKQCCKFAVTGSTGGENGRVTQTGIDLRCVSSVTIDVAYDVWSSSYSSLSIGIAGTSYSRTPTESWNTLTFPLTSGQKIENASIYVQANCNKYGYGTTVYITNVTANSTQSAATSVSFTANSSSTCEIEVGESVSFASTITGGCPTDFTYLWTFGDGDTSTAANPSHTYLTTGTYNVGLEVTNDIGSTSHTTSSCVTVGGVTCDFSADVTSGGAETEVTFTASTTVYPSATLNYTWKVDGATAPTGDEWEFKTGSTYQSQNPVIIFNDYDIYSISLEVETSDEKYSDTESKANYITIYEVPPFTPPDYDSIRNSFGIVNGTTILKERRS